MFENIIKFFKKLGKKEKKESSNTAKERLHLVLMQDRANVSADFLELMRQEIIEVIKKYIDIDEKAIDVKLTNKTNEDGTVGAPALYANIPIITIKNDARKLNIEKPSENNKESLKADSKETKSIESQTSNETETKEGKTQNQEEQKENNEEQKENIQEQNIEEQKEDIQEQNNEEQKENVQEQNNEEQKEDVQEQNNEEQKENMTEQNQEKPEEN